MAGPKDNSQQTCFLNVDLDIYSRQDLEPLVNALGRKVIVLHAGRGGRRYCAHLELARTAKSPDQAIRALCDVVKTLPAQERRWWDTAASREFNIGVQAGMQPHSSDFAVEAGTLRAVAELGGRLVFTVYAPEGAD